MLAGSFIHARTSEAATYYVATNGNDSNPGTQTQPFRSLTKGVNALKAGDTLYLRAGVYSSIDASTIPSGTSWTSATHHRLLPRREGDAHPAQLQVLPVLHFCEWQPPHHPRRPHPRRQRRPSWMGSRSANGSHHIRFINGEIKNAGQNGDPSWPPVPAVAGMSSSTARVHDGGGRGPHDRMARPALEHGVYIGADSNGVIDNCDIYNHRYRLPACTMLSGSVRDAGQLDESSNSGIWNSLRQPGSFCRTPRDALVYNNVDLGKPVPASCARNNGMQILNNAVYGNLRNFVPAFGSSMTVPATSPRQGAGATVANNIVGQQQRVLWLRRHLCRDAARTRRCGPQQPPHLVTRPNNYLEDAG